MTTAFQLRDKVMSQPIGTAESFKGLVVQITLNGKGNVHYLVMDEHGDTWHRDSSDLKLVVA
jgi:hypothetical protein